MAFKEGHKRWNRAAAKRELEEVDEAEELWIAAGLFREQQRRELGESYEAPRHSRSPSRARKWSNWDMWQPLEAGAPQRGAHGRIPAQLRREMRMKKSGVRRSSNTGSSKGHPGRKGSNEAGRGVQGTRTTRRTAEGAVEEEQRQAGCLEGCARAYVHKVGAVGNRLPADSLPLPEWPARPDTWPTKGQLDDEATYYVDLVPVKDVEWIIQNTDSNGGFKCSHSDNLVKYKIWPNNTHKSLHPSQKTWRKTTWALVQVNKHERYVASKAERLAQKMASMAVSSAAEDAPQARNQN